jgi:predicted metal-binding membrane protein
MAPHRAGQGSGVQHTPTAGVAPSWWRREDRLSGFVLVTVTALAWSYTVYGGSMAGMPMSGATVDGGMAGMEMVAEVHAGMDLPGRGALGGISMGWHPADLAVFLLGWAVMMVAMMLPAALPLIVLYRTSARRRLAPRAVAFGTIALLGGYFLVWVGAGVPVYAYGLLLPAGGSAIVVLPAMLLIAGGAYQFTTLKQRCHTRCSSPFFFLTRQWRPGSLGAARLGVLHGIDCLGCCVGLMLGLVGLGMMNIAWMLTATLLIFVEKTLPGGHRVARPLGAALVIGGLLVLGAALLGGRAAV